MTESLPSSSLGPTLRCWCLLHRVKQTHAVELLGVAQSTISRWESGTQALLMEEQARLERLLGAHPEAAADQTLACLVEVNPQPVYLVCDLTHRLLACSLARAAQLGMPLGELLDRSLWPYCGEEILRQEATLEELGWRELLTPSALKSASGANTSAIVSIRRSRCRWTRMTLSDGRTMRLVEVL